MQKRLQALIEVREYKTLELAHSTQKYYLDRVLEQVNKVHLHLTNTAHYYEPNKAELNGTAYFTKRIGDIKFYHLHSRYLEIVGKVIEVYNGNYIDWIDTVEG